jgi:hypothetical protein
MKFVSLLFASMAAYTHATPATSRGLQSLADKWNITDPLFEYDGLSFDLDYGTSDFIADTMSEWVIYDEGCREGGNAALVINELTSVMAVTKTVSGDAYLSTGGNGDRNVELNITINTEQIFTDSSIYSESVNAESQLIATVKFCVRLSLYTPTGGEKIEVNFLETLVTLNVDLTDGFAINDVAVAPKIKEVKTATQVYEVEAFQCGANNANLTPAEYANTRNQGSVIKVCVQPTLEGRQDGIFMRQIDSFTFNLDGDTVTQPAVEATIAASNGLTELDCGRGYGVCSFETILFASFYRVNGVVSGTGVASMQFGGSARRLRSGSRALQAADDVAGSAEFELNFDLVPVADTQSSDASGVSGLFAMTVVAFMGAAAML